MNEMNLVLCNMNEMNLIVSLITCLFTGFCALYAYKTFHKADEIKQKIDHRNNAIDKVMSVQEIKEIVEILHKKDGNVFFIDKEIEEYDKYIDITARERSSDKDHCPLIGRYRYYKNGVKLFKYDYDKETYIIVDQ